MKFSLSILCCLLLFSCGSGFHAARYSKLRWVKSTDLPTADSSHSAPIFAANPAPISSSTTSKSIATEAPVFIGETSPEILAVAPSLSDETPVMNSTPRSPVTERSIRTKGFVSIGMGALAVGGIVYGMILLVGGMLSGYLLILGAGLLAYLGMKLAMSSKRDIDTLSNRSTLQWLNRPATIGFVFNVSVLIAFGLLLLILLTAFI